MSTKKQQDLTPWIAGYKEDNTMSLDEFKKGIKVQLPSFNLAGVALQTNIYPTAPGFGAVTVGKLNSKDPLLEFSASQLAGFERGQIVVEAILMLEVGLGAKLGEQVYTLS